MGSPEAKISNVFYNLGFFARTLKGVGYFIRHSKTSYKILIMQILFTFVHALGISTLLALAIGAAVNIIGAPLLAKISQEQLIYTLL
jgi:phospholipid/cholesterol/gamma-HCH transport system permease protein